MASTAHRPPRVLLVVGTLGGGGAERQLSLFAAGVRDRAALHAFVLDPTGPHADGLRAVTRSWHEAGPRLRLRRAARFVAAAAAVRPDVVHCWHTFPVVYPTLTRPLHRRPLVVNLRGDLTRDATTGLARMHPATRWLRFADACVSNTEHSVEALRGAGVRLPTSEIIPNGIVVPPARTAPRRGDGVVRLVGVGTLKDLKNWPWLLRVAAKLRDSGTPVQVRVLGEGPGRPALTALAASLGFDPEAVFPGFVDDVPAALQQADVLVHPSRTEGQPNAVLEGLAAGLPAVTTDLPPCQALADEPGGFVRTAPLDDDDAMIAALRPWLDGAAARQRAGEAGRAWVAKHLGVERMVERYLAVYERLRSKRRPSS